MEYFNKLNGFQKFIFVVGWLAVLDIFFWIVLVIVNTAYSEEKFWNNKAFKIVYVFGWINLIGFILGFLAGIFGFM